MPATQDINRSESLIRTLVVDDSEVMLATLCNYLESLSYIQLVGTAQDGFKAFELVGPLWPDLVIVDFDLPGRNGLETARQIRRRFPHVIVIIVSAHEPSSWVDHARASGAVAGICKSRLAAELPGVLVEHFSARFPVLKKLAGDSLDFGRQDAAGARGEFSVSGDGGLDAHARLEAITDMLRDVAVILLDGDGRVVEWSEGAIRLTGCFRQQAQGRHLGDWYPQELRDSDVPDKHLGAAAQEGYIEREGWRLREDGTRFWARVTVRHLPACGERGEGYLCLLRDLDSMKQLERELRECDERFHLLVENSRDIVAIVGADGSLSYVSPGALPSLGYEPAELVGRNGLDYVHPDDLKSAQEALVCSLQPDAPQHPVEFRFRHRDGSWVWLEGVGGNLPDEAGQPRIVINCRDVSVRREMQKALRESETRFRQLAESINEVFWIATPSRAEIHYVSPAYDRIWERSGEKLLLRPSSWLESVVPEDRERVAASVEEKGTAGAGEVTYRIRRPNGTVRWIRDRIFPILNDGGGVHLLAGVSRDVTGEIALEEQLRHSQKLEAVGQLAGGVAHDFNNLLAIIQMQSSLLLMDAKLAPELRAGLEEIATAAECGSHLTRQLLTFSRRQQKEAVAVDLGSVVSRTIKMLRRIIGAEVKIESKLEDDLPAVLADPGMLEQVLMNLAVNARDAMPRGGRLVIALDAVRLDAAHVARHPQARPGRFVRLTVSDTGEGIKPEIQQHIFEPFFTTKEVGKGTGLGLATVQGVIRQHDGWIEYSSEVGKGTIFRIYLPPLEHAVSTRPAKPDRSFNVRGTESVLLVEDDPGVRSLARVILIRHGYRVVEAATGTEVLDKLVEAKTGFDLLLTDVVLPGGVSGIELANRLRRQSPNLKVVYTSGYGREFIGEQEQVELGRDFLPKPYLAHDLVVAVRRCLDGG